MIFSDSGKPVTSDLNELYGGVISRNRHLITLVDLNAPEIIISNEKRMLQQEVNRLFMNSVCENPRVGSSERPFNGLNEELVQVIEQLECKPAMCSGKGVVVPDTTVPVGVVGLPRQMCREMLRLHAVDPLKAAGFVDTIKGALKLLDSDPIGEPALWAYRETMAALSVLVVTADCKIGAFRPREVDGEAIRLHPDSGNALGLSFQGEQIFVHVPLSGTANIELQQSRLPAPFSSGLADLNANKILAMVNSSTVAPLTDYDRILLGFVSLPSAEPPTPDFKIPPPRAVLLPSATDLEIERKLNMTLADLGLSAAAKSRLETAGFTTVRDVITQPDQAFLQISNFDEAMLAEVKSKLGELGLDLLLTSVDVLNLSVRARKCFNRGGIKTLADLTRQTAGDLLKNKNFGMTSLTEIREKLKQLGLSLRDEELTAPECGPATSDNPPA
jgi:hypothetical protein